MLAKRRPGPKKGDGGRPRRGLFKDPDRFIIVVALWHRKNRRSQREPELIKFLILLFTDCEAVEVATDDARRDLAERGGDPAAVHFSLENKTPPRVASSTNYPSGSSAPTPGNSAYMKSRVGLIQGKIAIKYQRLRHQDAQWLAISYFGLDQLCAGRIEMGLLSLRAAGWPLYDESTGRPKNNAAINRLAQMLRGIATLPATT